MINVNVSFVTRSTTPTTGDKKEKVQTNGRMDEYTIRDINLLIGDQTVTITADHLAQADSGRIELTAQVVSEEESDSDNEVEINISAIKHKGYISRNNPNLHGVRIRGTPRREDNGASYTIDDGERSPRNRTSVSRGNTRVDLNSKDVQSFGTQCDVVHSQVAGTQSEPKKTKSLSTQSDGINTDTHGTQSEWNTTTSLGTQSECVVTDTQGTQYDALRFHDTQSQTERDNNTNQSSQTGEHDTDSDQIEVEHLTIPIEIRLPPSSYANFQKNMENLDNDSDSGYHDNAGIQGDKDDFITGSHGGEKDDGTKPSMSDRKTDRLNKLARAQKLLEDLKTRDNSPCLSEKKNNTENEVGEPKLGQITNEAQQVDEAVGELIETASLDNAISDVNKDAKESSNRNKVDVGRSPLKRSPEQDVESLSLYDKSPGYDDEYDEEDDDFSHYASPRGRGMRPVEDFNRFQLMPKPQAKPAKTKNREPHKKFSKRGKLARFFRNGDPHFKGLPVSVSQKCFVTYKTLLEWLNEKITTTAGVRYIFSWPEGREIKDVTEFVGGRSYVVSSTKKLNREVDYGYESRESFWSNTKSSAGRLRKGEKHLYVGKLDDLTPSSPTAAKPRIMMIISNTNRDSREKVMLNPNTMQTFEEMLQDIQSMVLIDRPPVRALFTAKHPHKRVSSYSQLFQDFKTHDTFLACGDERQPFELNTPKRQIQSSNSSNDSALNVFTTRKPKKKPKKSDVALMDLESVDSFVQQSAPPPALIKPKPATKRKNHGRSQHPGRFQTVPQTSRSLSPQPVGRRHPGRFRNIPEPSPRSMTPSPTPKPASSTPVRPPRQRYTPSPSPKPASTTPVRPPPRRYLPRRQTKPCEVVRVDIHGNRREFYSPSHQDKVTTEKPAKKLKLDWVYGYRGRDAKNNLYVLPSGEIMYYVASVAVIYNKLRETQRLYTGHNEDISSMALHPNEIYVATGQFSGDKADTTAHVRIWDSKSLNTYSILGLGVFQRGLSSLNFSQQSEGDYLMAIDDGDKHTMTVWRWSEEKVIAQTTMAHDRDFARIVEDTSTETVVWCSFHPDDDSIIITFGKQHIFFWKIFTNGKKGEEVRILRDKKSGIFMNEVPQYVTSLAFAYNGDVITGDSSGGIVVWHRGTNDSFTVDQGASEYMRHAHKKSVFALCMMDDGTLLSGGGHEVRAWDTVNGYRHVKERILPESAGYVRGLVPEHSSSGDGQLYIGTTKNAILEGTMHSKFKFLIQGHYEELWALAAYPEEHAFVTAGYDHHVCKWSAVSHRLLWRIHVEKPCLCVDANMKGRLIALGTTVGHFIILNGQNGSHITTVQAGTDGITVIKFAPDGSMVAMGTQAGNIYVYHVLENGQFYRRHKEGMPRGHHNFIMQLDWSYDSRSLQTVSGDYDILYWNVEDMTQEKQAKEMKDIDWYTQTCSLGYNLLGAWSNLEEDEDIDTVARSNYQDYLAVGNNQGKIRLYRYPCSAHKPDCYEKKHYSSHVTNIQFMFDDSFVISSGGADAGLLQWSLSDPITPR